jgi:hypothetical protein
LATGNPLEMEVFSWEKHTEKTWVEYGKCRKNGGVKFIGK